METASDKLPSHASPAAFRAGSRRIAVACALVAAVSVLVLAGWALQQETLMRVHPSFVPMHPVTAVLFLLSAAALWGLRRPPMSVVVQPARMVAIGLAALVALAGTVKLGEHFLGLHTGIDQWLFPDRLGPAVPDAMRNEIAPNTALAFVLAGAALLLLDRGARPGRRPAEWLAAAVAGLATLALLGYAYRVEAMYRMPTFLPMAVHTAISFLLLAMGILWSRRWLGVAALFSGGRPDSRMARRLLLGSIAIVAGIGWLRLAGERAGLYGSELGVTYHTAAMVVLLALLVAGSAWALHRSEDERRRAEEERARLFAITPDLFCVAGFDGHFRSLNPSWERLLGWTREELRARPFLEFVHPDDRGFSIERLGSLAQGEPALAFENRFVDRDGNAHWISWNAIPVPEEGVIYASGRDVTREREDARRLLRGEEQLRAIIDTAHDAFVAMDAEGKVTDWNAQAEAISGWKRKEALGRPLATLLVPPRHRAAHAAGLARYLATGEGNMLNRPVEIEALHRSGREFPVELTIWPIGSGRDCTFNAFLRDISIRKAAERSIRDLNAELASRAEELRQSNRELESFSYSVSHDLRAPLRHIDGYARMLQEDAGDALDGDCRRYLDEIGGAARRMGALIDDLLAFSRLGRKPLERGPLRMRALVEEVVAESGGAGKVQLGELPDAHGDPVLLRQVWVNLVSNALKYSAPRGEAARIVIEGARQDGRVRYRVRDNGVGFDMRFADKLFGVFQRLHSQDEFEGTGVGLAIVQRIVLRHGGQVHAEAEPGQGATFGFALPDQASPGDGDAGNEYAASDHADREEAQ
jgi:PAS domain S-box-containing protein